MASRHLQKERQSYEGAYVVLPHNIALTSRQILSVYDLPPTEAMSMIRQLRRAHVGPNQPLETSEQFQSVLDLVGGRTSFLARVARADDMVQEAQAMVQTEKAWLLSKWVYTHHKRETPNTDCASPESD